MVKIKVSLAPSLVASDSRAGDDVAGYAITQTAPGFDAAVVELPDAWIAPQIDAWVSDQIKRGRLSPGGALDGDANWRYLLPRAFAPLVIGPPQIGILENRALGDSNAVHGITEQVQRRGKYGRGLAAVVLDTPLDNAHPLFAGKIARSGGVGRTTETHATHVLGIILSIAPDATIFHYAVLPQDRGSEDLIQQGFIEATDWLTQAGLQGVFNCSFGAEGLVSRLIDQGCEYARSRNHVVCVAAGNRYGGKIGSPCRTADWKVLALERDGARPTDFSSGPDWVGEDAQRRTGYVGRDVYSSLPGNSYGLMSGTSMATPGVVGCVALRMAG